MTDWVRAAAARALEPLRRTVGRRNVNWTPEFMGFGNQLYLWCWAHERRHDRQRPRVLITDRTRPWLAEVPGFAARFLIERADVSLLDRRGHYWARKEAESGHAQGFSPGGRIAFITEALLPEPLLAGVQDSPLNTDRSLTIVVRRGDFYDDPHHRAWYAFDVAAYVRLAVAGSIERDGEVDRIHVVSDDVEWCRTHLPFLAESARGTWAGPSDSAASNFRDACGSRRLVITNGTFCLWVAFISRTLHGQDPGLIWAPAFFQSTYGPGRCVEYDPDFSFIDDLPGGWQPEWVLEGQRQA